MMSVRVYLKNLEDFVVRGRKTGEKYIAGSVPPESEEFISHAEQMGYNTSFLKRVPHENGMREQFVDGNLQMRMLDTLLEHNNNEVIALLSGDSHVDIDSGYSFVSIAEKALKRGWSVEVYAVKDTISNAIYVPLKEKYGSSLQIEYFDNIYRSITFIVGGDYSSSENPNETVHVDQRIVEEKTW